MNCRTFRKRQAELLDAYLDPVGTADLVRHAAECSECARELGELRAAMAGVRPTRRLSASQEAKERIMDSIAGLDSATTTPAVKGWFYSRLVRTGALAAIVLALVFTVGRFAGHPSKASSTLAQAAEYIQGVKSMHIVARMRTWPQENLDTIDLKAPLIPIEMWKEFSTPPKVRVEKEKRKIVEDGKTTVLMVLAGKSVLAAKFDGRADGCFSTVAPLLSPDSLFRQEKESAESSGSTVEITANTGADGREKTVLTISARAQGDYSQSEHTKNTSIITSDNIRIYTFDAETYRCEAMQVYVNTEKGKVLVFETTRIEYDEPVDAALFHLDVPKTAIWTQEPSVSPSRDTSSMRPDEFARLFFDALSSSDTQELRQIGAAWLCSPEALEDYRGLTVVSIGEPFKSGLYPGYFVPYEIRLKSGQIRKFKLAVRNDNPKHQWDWDGGL